MEYGLAVAMAMAMNIFGPSTARRGKRLEDSDIGIGQTPLKKLIKLRAKWGGGNTVGKDWERERKRG